MNPTTSTPGANEMTSATEASSTPSPASRPAGSPWSIAHAAAYLGISTRQLFRLADAGKIKTIYMGSRRLVPDAEVQRVATEGTH